MLITPKKWRFTPKGGNLRINWLVWSQEAVKIVTLATIGLPGKTTLANTAPASETTNLALADANSAYIRKLLGFFADTPAKEKMLLDTTGLKRSHLYSNNPTISALSKRIFFQNIDKFVGEGWVLKNKELWAFSKLNNVSRIVRSSPTIGDAIDMVTRYGYLQAPTSYFEQYRNAKSRILAFDFVLADAYFSRSWFEMVSVNTQMLFEGMLDQPLTECELWSSYPEPLYAPLYKEVFAGKVKFDMPYHAIVVPEHLCHVQSKYADPDTFNAKTLEILSRIGNQQKAEQFAQTVRQYLTTFKGSRPTLDQVARAMRVSTRTMNRRLGDAGKTFSGLLNEVLKERFQALSANNDLSRTEIAAELGYQDPSSLSRAQRKWRLEMKND